MELWSEYEGRTIDGAFPLTKLLQPEGRSAFFSTPNGTGTPTVIRLIESHFDDDRIVARWRRVAALNHPSLVKLKRFGKVEMDGAPLVYGVMESADGNLGEIVSVRRLTVEETREVAESLVGALGALHENGFVHEHVEPGSVLAVGEQIKLRSDCIRETPEGDEGAAAKRHDVRDLAAVLLRSLTQRRSLEDAKRELPLAAPFDAIVRNGLSGSWGLGEIRAALAPDAAPKIAATAVEPVAAAVAVAPAPATASSAVSVTSPANTAPAVPVISATAAEKKESRRAETAIPSSLLTDEDKLPSSSAAMKMALITLGVILLVWIGWRMFGGSSPKQGAVRQTAPVAAQAASVQPAGASVAEPGVQKPSAMVGDAARSAASAGPVAGAATGAHVEWRVIAFTYNHEEQAKTKVERLAGRHPELSPEVFTPNGRAPYLVSIGGSMSREDAYALARKARSEGVAGDVYAQNFHVTRASE